MHIANVPNVSSNHDTVYSYIFIDGNVLTNKRCTLDMFTQ